jgi:Tol biopolymer transport system component
MLGLLVTMVVLALSACGGGQENKKSATGDSAANGQIAFRRWFDPDQTKAALFTMNSDGSHVRQIIHPPEGWRDLEPGWSPDGQKLAFYREAIDESMSRIMVLNPKTGFARIVTQCTGRCVADYDPAWAPDGDSLAFSRIIGPDRDCCRIGGIWIVGFDGSDPHQVTNVDPKLPAAFSDEGMQFSPDGKMLVFDRVRVADERHAVFVQSIGSPQDARQITPWKLNCQDHPDWSPDGKLVLFRCLLDDGSVNVYWAHPDGTGLHQLTQAAADKQTHYYLSSSFSPSFSANEGWITTSREPGYGKEANADVVRFLIEGGEVVRELNLTKSAIWDSAPDWGSKGGAQGPGATDSPGGTDGPGGTTDDGGTDGPDTLKGTVGNDTLLGRDGDDELFALGGRDKLLGGPGRDVVLGGSEEGPLEGDKNLQGGFGNDLIAGGIDSDNVVGNAGNDLLSGDASSDIIAGNSGNDLLIDGPLITDEVGRVEDVLREDSKDTLSGNVGNDWIDAKNTPAFGDTVTCDEGFDRVLTDSKDVVAADCERVTSDLTDRQFFETIPQSFFEGLPQF